MACDCKENTYYKYYDTPEGCDIVQKTIVTARYGFITGLVLSTYDVLMYSHASGLFNVLRRYAYHTIPLSLMGATFAAVANTLVNVRNENDELNYIAGACASAPILGAYLGSMHAWFIGSIGLSAIALAKKSGVDNGWTFFPRVERETGHHFWFHKTDFSWMEDPRDEQRRACAAE